MAAAQKDIIYIDVDDEITSIIDKVTGSSSKIVALVLPKRAAMLQSIVNMKLLKRSASTNKKHIVLITSEAGLLPLAGAVGLHVAKTLQSKPAVPPAPDLSEAGETVVAEPVAPSAEPEIDPSKPVGELAGFAAVDEDETIEVDNSDQAVPVDPAVTASDKSKKFKIPNFERFRTRLLLGVLALVLLLVGWFVLGGVLPRAKITIRTDTNAITSNIAFTASTGAKEINMETRVVPAELKEVKKTDAEKVPATGQKDVGDKATGSVTLTNCDKDDETVTIPAGTGVSANNLTFITKEAVTIPPSNFSGGGACKNDSSKNVSVVAQNAGDGYNLSPRAYTVAGFTSVLGYGSAMTGGTSKIVKVVSDQDVENAKQKIGTRSSQDATDEVKQSLKEAGLYGINETLTTGQPAVTASPTVGQEAAEVTVTSIVTYSMFGVKEEYLNRLLEEEINKQIDIGREEIQKTGLESAVFQIVEKKSPTELRLSMQALTVVGPKIDEEAVKREVAGKKRGETQNIIQNRPGVRDAVIDYSPFWVFSTPRKTGGITIVIESADGN